MCYFYYGGYFFAKGDPWKLYADPITIYYEPIESSGSVTKTTTITINNKTWNGNIYIDNSNNLTYIYPSYTTITEEGDTVTNISNTSIVYDSTTNEYVLYDNTTNNYYYITYETTIPTPAPTIAPEDDVTAPAWFTNFQVSLAQMFADLSASFTLAIDNLSANFTLAIENLNLNIQNFFDKKIENLPEATATPESAATPTPSPSITPAPSTSPSASPDPTVTPDITPSPSQHPTPTATPSGDGDGGSSWWIKLINALVGGLLDAIGAVIGLFLKIVSKILSWVIWATSQIFTLLPFLPPGLGALLLGGVVICVIIGIIKFIRG